MSGFAKLITYLFEGTIITGLFETTVYLEMDGIDPLDALINLAAGMQAGNQLLDDALNEERERVGDKTIDELLGRYQIEPGAAHGGVIITVKGFIEESAKKAEGSE